MADDETNVEQHSAALYVSVYAIDNISNIKLLSGKDVSNSFM